MKNVSICLALAMMLVMTAGSAAAQDLVGKWVEIDNWGTRSGESEHELGDGDFFLTMENAMFTLTVTEQSADKRGFHGKWCSENACEDLVGAVRVDGSLLMTDEDGYFEGTLLGDTMELCYLEATEDIRIANCRIMQKQ
jgi:hypothetical protein